MACILTAFWNRLLQEKCKKILDIWAKSNTFPSAVLGRLTQYVKGATEKEPDNVVATTAEHRQPISTTSISPPPAAPPAAPLPNSLTGESVQSTLLALLSQAKNAVAAANNGQISSNTTTLAPISGPALDANQLALFQQLTQAAKQGNGISTQPISLPVSLVPSSSSTSAIPVVPLDESRPQPPPFRDDHSGFDRREPPYNSYGGPDRPRDRDDYYDDRRPHRGGFRGSHRGRGRGRWDDRDRHRDRGRNREWNSPPRGRDSRSRSPPSRYGGRRDPKPYSPRRHSVSQGDRYRTNPAGPPGAPDGSVGKDEFGRDVRMESPATGSDSTPTGNGRGHQFSCPPGPSSFAAVEQGSSTFSVSDKQSPRRETSTPHSPPIKKSDISVQSQQKGGLDSFDMSTFDPSSAASWEALGDAWIATHGYPPSHTEVMQFMLASMGDFPVPNEQTGQWPAQENDWNDSSWRQPNQGPWRGGRERGGKGRGGGDYGHGNGRGAGFGGTRVYEEPDERGIHYGADYDTNIDSWQVPTVEHADLLAPGKGGSDDGQGGMPGLGGSTSTGKMQKVGDKWVFVRTEAS
ncbi:uncharacterized protein FIBRA_04642 [Fibroporia radiculosa]|uniref:CID domain-containing protein n=1 Tax=Fibroporia radiculosa TaxID=599839 RepID=J4GPK7_9APHY|nr:uncharacterized protein FIBRA_04642 [Fibroporia radiculosa]CCM02540.1 predicted protein [Fibroporia radiculosa]